MLQLQMSNQSSVRCHSGTVFITASPTAPHMWVIGGVERWRLMGTNDDELSSRKLHGRTTCAGNRNDLTRSACNANGQAPYLYYWHAGT